MTKKKLSKIEKKFKKIKIQNAENVDLVKRATKTYGYYGLESNVKDGFVSPSYPNKLEKINNRLKRIRIPNQHNTKIDKASKKQDTEYNAYAKIGKGNIAFDQKIGKINEKDYWEADLSADQNCAKRYSYDSKNNPKMCEKQLTRNIEAYKTFLKNPNKENMKKWFIKQEE